MSTATRSIPQRPLAYIDPGTGLVVVTVAGWLLGVITGILGLMLLFAKRIGRFLRGNWKPLLGLALAVAATLAAWLYQRNRIVVADDIGRVVVLAFDGLDPRRVERLMDAGVLPNLEALRRRGTFRRLATSIPAQSPVAWATFATGKNPGKHGVFDFIQRNPQTYLPMLSMAQFDRGKPQRAVQAPGFWHYAGQAGIPSFLLALPANFPPDQLNGRALAGMGVPDLMGTEGTFSYFTDAPPGDGDVAGRVVTVRRTPTLTLYLRGPLLDSGDPSRSMFTVTPQDAHSAHVRIATPAQQVELRVGQWSDWIDVEFELGWWRKAHGIVRMLLQETEPGFRLYVTPVNIDPRQPFWPISVPPSYAGHLAEHLGLYYTQGMPLNTWALNEDRLDEPAFIAQAKTVHAERYEQLFYELARFDAGIFYAYFEDPDIVQHMFMRYEDPAHPDAPTAQTARYANIIDAWYKRCDTVVGDVQQRLLPDDTLLVISDHGFGTFRRAVHLNTWLLHNGYLALQPGADVGEALFANVDWTRTVAYAAGFGGIYLNVAGRERDGIVANNRAARAALSARIATDLRRLTDAGTPVVRRVFNGLDVYHGPYAEAAPDLVVGFHDGYRASWQTALGAAPQMLIDDNLKKWSGDHLIDPALVPGVLFANRSIAATAPSLLDLAPSLLKAAGLDDAAIKAAAFDGSSFF